MQSEVKIVFHLPGGQGPVDLNNNVKFTVSKAPLVTKPHI